MARFDSTGTSPLDKEINIRIRPRSLMKGSIGILVLVLVFFLGRWSVDPSAISLETAAVAPAEEVELAEPEAEVEAEEDEDSESFFSGLFGKWFSSEPEDTITPAAVAAVNSSNITVAEEAAGNATNTTEAAPAEEPIITTYSKVAVAINDVDFDWKGTWGKITKVDYTIRNNEAGTVKPDHLGMMVEGYEDFEKKIPLPLSSKTVKAGQSASSKVQVPQGFSYSEITAGNLADVVITFTLYDAGDKVMASFKTAYNLQG